MPLTMPVNQTVVNIPHEFDAAVPPNELPVDPANIQWGSDDMSIANVVKQPDGSGKVTGFKVGSCSIIVSDTKFGLSYRDTLTLTAAPGDPSTLTFTWGTPS